MPASDHDWQINGSWVNLDFNYTPLKGYTADNNSVYVNVSGGLRINDPKLEARYSGCHGYMVGLTLKEESFLAVTFKMTLKEEIRIPFFTVGADCGDVGMIGASLVLIVRVDGSLRVEVYASEYGTTTFGLRGKTLAWVPLSCSPFYSLSITDRKADCNIHGKIDASVRLGPEMGLKIFGFEVVGAGAYVGAGIAAKTVSSGSTMIDVDVYLIFELYASLLGWRKNIVNEHPSLKHKRQQNMQGYKFTLEELYAYPGRISGVLWKEADIGNPYAVDGYVPVVNTIDKMFYRIKANIGYILGSTKHYIKEYAQYFPSDGWLRVGDIHGPDGKYQNTIVKNGVVYVGDGLGEFAVEDIGDDYYNGYEWRDYGLYNDGINWEDLLTPPTGYEILDISVEFKQPKSEDQYHPTPGTEFESEHFDIVNPFSEVTIFEADYFNDFLRGQIAPLQLRDWVVKGKDVQYKTAYPPEDMTIYIYTAGSSHNQTKNAYVTTDDQGYFDTRKPSDTIHSFHSSDAVFEKDGKNYRMEPDGTKDVNPFFKISSFSNPGGGAFGFQYYLRRGPGIYGSYNMNESYYVSCSVAYEPTMPPFFYNRQIIPVAGSQKKTEMGNGTIVDQMDYDEMIWIINPSGERALSDEEFSYAVGSIFSRVDPPDRDKKASELYGGESLSMDEIKQGTLIRTVESAVGELGSPGYVGASSTTMFTRRVTAEWVWQAHPDPARITSPNYLMLTPDGDSYQLYTGGGLSPPYTLLDREEGTAVKIAAEGICPAFYLEGAPPGVTIDRDTGLMEIPKGMGTYESRVYDFKLCVVQEYRGDMVPNPLWNDEFQNVMGLYLNWPDIPDYDYYMHDAPPPDEIPFKLTILKDENAQPPVAPEINRTKTYPETRGATGFNFLIDEGESFTALIEATGDEPIRWSLTPADYSPTVPPPDFVKINEDSGLMSVINAVPRQGNYTFSIVATNDAGDDYVDCTIQVIPESGFFEEDAPVISFSEPGYTIQSGAAFQTTYTLEGVLPIAVTLEARDVNSGAVVSQIKLNESAKSVYALAGDLAIGAYDVTATAENKAGTDSATFRLVVAPNAPEIMFAQGVYSVQKGTAVTAPYTVTGTEPITVTVAAITNTGVAVQGVTVNASAKTVNVPASLSEGIYTVTATAKNDTGQSSAEFRLEVKAEAATPPVITVSNTSYSTQQGTAFQTAYTLTGTEPITVTVAATNSRGTSVTGFTVNAASKTVSAPSSLTADMYTLTATAKNSAGESTASFTLEVTPVVVLEPPVIQAGRHYFNFDMNAGDRAVSETITATGSEPITWSLRPSATMGLPGFVSINSSSGLLTINPGAAGTYYFIVRAENAAGSDEREFTVSIRENRTAPRITTIIRPDAPESEMEQGTDYRLQFEATGSEPLTWTLEPIVAATHVTAVPDEARIDGRTGLLTIRGSIAAGSYSFIVRVTNDMGTDTFDFSVTVQEAGSTRPGFPGRRTSPVGAETPAIALLSASAGGSGAVRLLSSGLQQFGQVEVPNVAGGNSSSSASTSTAYKYAEYLASEETNHKSLKYKAAVHLTGVEWQATSPDLSDPDWYNNRPPSLNTDTVRWDHKKDIYTNDRFNMNGAEEYVFWHTWIEIWPSEERTYGFAGTDDLLGQELDDWYPEKYHNLQKSIEEYKQDAQSDFITALNGNLPREDIVRALRDDYIKSEFGSDFPGSGDFGDWLDDFLDSSFQTATPTGGNVLDAQGIDQRVSEGRVIDVTVLNYGSTVDAIASQGGGQHMVGLGGSSGTTVVGEYFEALRGNPQAGITFMQDGANITFVGSDVSKTGDFGLYDLGYTQGSFNEQEMLGASGMAGSQYFTYSFEHHGDLPGTATFDITTSIAEGSKVNVYKFDAETGSFTAIAEGLTVGAGGLVSYTNNTMSEYMITTGKINGALKPAQAANWLLYGIIIAAVVLLAAVAIVVLVIRKKKKSAPIIEPPMEN